MHYSKEVEKMVMPMTIVWLALTATLVIYGGLLFYLGKNSMTDVQPSNLKNILMPLSYVPFILTFIFHKKLHAIVRKGNMDRAPYAANMNDEDKKSLEFFGSYFVTHIILWAFNESGAIMGFVLSMVTGNIQYYLYPAIIAIFLNLVVMRPRYFDFIKGQRFE